jgi:Cof subfamily protein (haloacid dehalogenase superfamily)
MPTRGFRILALDVDGTVLDSEGNLRPRTAAAVRRAAEAGIQPILCTGRRYRRAVPILRQLGLQTPLVCNSGAIVKDPTDHRTLWRADFNESLVTDLFELFRSHDQPAVVFTDRDPREHDFIVAAFPTGRVHFDDYVLQNHPHAQIDAGWRWAGRVKTAGSLSSELLSSSHDADPLFHVCAVGTLADMQRFQLDSHEVLSTRVQTFVQRSSRYLGTMCEFLRHDATKWTAILHLAEFWGVGPAEICAVGDDVNDIPMLENAGLGVAMGHSHPEVVAAADIVTGRHDDEGVAMFIEDVLLGGTG